jgi:16S rRNA U516 pseudouridylate synthase RsuA-like enzyme
VSCLQVDEFRPGLTIAEGKCHQFKRMIAVTGTNCRALERIALSDQRLEKLSLAERAWTYIDPRSIAR